MPSARRILALSLGLFSLASLGQAAGWMTGCFLCLPHNFGVDADDKCKMVGTKSTVTAGSARMSMSWERTSAC